MTFRELQIDDYFISPLDELKYKKSGPCYARRVSDNDKSLSVNEYYFQQDEEVERVG